MLTFAQLCDEVARVAETGMRSTDDIRTSFKRWVNNAGRWVAYQYPWKMREKAQTIRTVAPYVTGTATFTEGDETVTFSGATITSAMVGRKIARSVGGPYYRIASRTSGTEVELDEAYAEDTASGVAFSIFQDEYDLLATTHSIQGVFLYRDRALGPLDYIKTNEADLCDFVGSETGAPRGWTICPSTTSGTPRMRLFPIPDDLYRVRIRYQPTWTALSADGDVAVLPDDCEEILLDRALRWIPKMEGQRRVMRDDEAAAALRDIWIASQSVRPRTGRRRQFDAGGSGRWVSINVTGLLT